MNATAATAKMTSTNGIVTLVLSTGDSYSVKDGSTFLARLDRKIGNDGWTRSGYRSEDGAMVADLKRSKLLADFVASR